jgi:hypothetical protein
LISQVIVGAVIVVGLVDENAEHVAWFRSLDRLKRCSAIVVAGLSGLLLGPFLFPYLLYMCFRDSLADESPSCRISNRTYRPLLLDPVHQYNFAPDIWDHFETEQPAFTAHNFQTLGEFLVKGPPIKIEARLLLHPTGNCLAEVGVAEDFPYIELISFLEDGSVISTSNGPRISIESQLAEKGYFLKSLPNLDSLELMDQHDFQIQLAASMRRSDLREVPEADWKTYFRYHNQKLGNILFQQGLLDNGPESFHFPDRVPTETSCQSQPKQPEPNAALANISEHVTELKIYKE